MNTKSLKIFGAGLMIFGFFVMPIIANADAVTDTIENITDWITRIAGVLVVLMIVIGAIFFITAGSDTTKIDTGKKMITYAAVGFAIVLLANALVSIVQSLVAS